MFRLADALEEIVVEFTGFKSFDVNEHSKSPKL